MSKFVDPENKKMTPGRIIAIIVFLAVVGAIIYAAASSTKTQSDLKTQNTTYVDDTANHVAEIAELYKQGKGYGTSYPDELSDMSLVIPEYHDVTYTNDDDKGFCVIVEDKDNNITVSFDSEAGGLNTSGGACK